jgi:hypothetical protein
MIASFVTDRGLGQTRPHKKSGKPEIFKSLIDARLLPRIATKPCGIWRFNATVRSREGLAKDTERYEFNYSVGAVLLAQRDHYVELSRLISRCAIGYRRMLVPLPAGCDTYSFSSGLLMLAPSRSRKRVFADTTQGFPGWAGSR